MPVGPPRLIGLTSFGLWLSGSGLAGTCRFPRNVASGWRAILLTWQRGGWVGVDLFFVLSGFPYPGCCLPSSTRAAVFDRPLVHRRGWKIYPPFLTLIAATVVGAFVPGVSVDKRVVASELSFLQSYVPGLGITRGRSQSKSTSTCCCRWC